MTTYAVNIIDWMTHKTDIGLSILLKPVVSLDSPTVECESGRVDSTGIILDCDPERGQAIVKIVRQKFKKYQFRFYESKSGKGGWKRI